MDGSGRQRKNWFGPKRIGFGIRPQTWQGWGVTLGVVLIIVAIVSAVDAAQASHLLGRMNGSRSRGEARKSAAGFDDVACAGADVGALRTRSERIVIGPLWHARPHLSNQDNVADPA